MEKGVLKPLHLHVFDKEKLQDAFRFMAQAKHCGKVVVRQKPALVQWSHSGAYVITDGFGGLGMQLAQWMSILNVSKIDGSTPLIIASEGCRLASVQYLIEAGAALEMARITETTALFVAAGCGHFEIVCALSRASKIYIVISVQTLRNSI